jgi:hypothetical protein
MSMKRIILFLLISFWANFVSAFTVVLVSPRGETSMEFGFKQELSRLMTPVKIEYVFLK